MNPKELLQRRAKLIEDARGLASKAETEKRDLSAEERESIDKMLNDAKALKADADRLTALEGAEGDVATAGHRRTTPDRPGQGGQAEVSPEVRAFRARYNIDADNPAYAAHRERTETPEARAAFRAFCRGTKPEALRDLAMGSGELGGYVVPDEQFVAELIAELDAAVFIRPLARVIPCLNAASLGMPSRTARAADSEWTTELQVASEDTSLRFGKRKLEPHPLSKQIIVSRDWLAMSPMNPEGIVRDEIVYVRSITQEKAYLTGSGAAQPLGIFTASALGVPTTQDVATSNTATSPTFDGLKAAKYKMRSVYWPQARFVMHQDTLAKIDILKDGEGRYIWQASVVPGQPDRLLGFPLDISEFAPNSFSANQYVAALCCWKHYYIADGVVFGIQRLSELYALSNQIGFIDRSMGDAMPVLGEAFVRVKLGT